MPQILWQVDIYYSWQVQRDKISDATGTLCPIFWKALVYGFKSKQILKKNIYITIEITNVRLFQT